MLKSPNTILFRRSSFLDFVVNRDGIHVNPDKVDAVKNWRRPETPTENLSY
jgi:hypothetical protein